LPVDHVGDHTLHQLRTQTPVAKRPFGFDMGDRDLIVPERVVGVSHDHPVLEQLVAAEIRSVSYLEDADVRLAVAHGALLIAVAHSVPPK